MVDEERAEKAVEFFRDNAEAIADARATVKYLDHKRKVVRATAFAEADGTMAEREAYAERHSDYQATLEEYRDAVYEAERIGTLLKAAELTIDVWRTQNANSRKGHV